MRLARKSKPPQWWSWDWHGRLLSGPPGGPRVPHTGPTTDLDGSIVWYRDGFPVDPPERRRRLVGRPVEQRVEQEVEREEEPVVEREVEQEEEDAALLMR